MYKMVKESLFITISSHHFPVIHSVLHELLKEKFEIVFWDKKERPSKQQLIENVKGKFGIICGGYNTEMDNEVIEAAGGTLKVVSTVSVGLDHLDIEYLKSKKIRIGYTPGVTVPAVAEHAIALLLATARKVIQGHNAILRGDWIPEKWNYMSITGSGLYKSTVAVVGCGRIGFSILKKLKPFDPKTIFYYSRSRKAEAEELGAEWKPLDVIMKESDFVIVALELNSQTKGIINRDMINSMKSKAILVNIARGGLLDENALSEALKNKKIAGAGLDVFNKEPLPLDSPLMKLNNVVLTPHLAGNYSDPQCQTSIAELAASNVLAVLNGTEMPAEFK